MYREMSVCTNEDYFFADSFKAIIEEEYYIFH
jgi:hypothetical protein